MYPIAFIDHYDSFSFNIIDWLLSLNAFSIEYGLYDNGDWLKSIKKKKIPIILSPGPKSPFDVSPSVNIARDLLGRVPILGICLGHQILGILAGMSIEKTNPRHGAKEKIFILCTDGIFETMPEQFYAAQYHSLIVKKRNILARAWKINAINKDKEIQGIVYRSTTISPAIGLQFHPESFLSEQSQKIALNFKKIIENYYKFNI